MTSVSIIVNCYNAERYVRECLDSILALEADVPLQVIVVDDASTDATPAILERYAARGFDVIRLTENGGAAKAIDLAFTKVTGDYVARIDYDDRYHPSFLRLSLAALQNAPEAAFVCARARMIGAGGEPGETVGPHDYGEAAGSSDRFLSLLERNFVTAPTILGRTSHWRRALPIPHGMNFCDWYMNLVMAEQAPVAVLDEVTADYRVHAMGMHARNIADGTGEAVTNRVLDRFLLQGPRQAEVARHAQRIRARHSAAWGDRYFGAGLNDQARRCYAAALRHDPALFWRGRFQHRLAGLMVGRERYERVKGWLSTRRGPDQPAATRTERS